MWKIGEFSKLSMLTVKTLRYYEKEGLLLPTAVDPWTGYRMYDTSQLETAAAIKALRQLDFTVEEIRAHLGGAPMHEALGEKRRELLEKQADISAKLSIIKFLSEDNAMKYQAVLKELPACTVYSEEHTLKSNSELNAFVMESAQECLRLNPGLACTKPDYCFLEYLDREYRERDVRVRYSQAVERRGIENERIRFRELPAAKAVCVYHHGAYELMDEAYAYVVNYAHANGYRISGLPRVSYLDGVWNRSMVEEWLTEIQLPVERNG